MSARRGVGTTGRLVVGQPVTLGRGCLGPRGRPGPVRGPATLVNDVQQSSETPVADKKGRVVMTKHGPGPRRSVVPPALPPRAARGYPSRPAFASRLARPTR